MASPAIARDERDARCRRARRPARTRSASRHGSDGVKMTGDAAGVAASRGHATAVSGGDGA